MGCRLRCTRPLHEPMLTTCQLNTIGAHFGEILIKVIVHWNNAFQNVVRKSGKHFVQVFVLMHLFESGFAPQIKACVDVVYRKTEYRASIH